MVKTGHEQKFQVLIYQLAVLDFFKNTYDFHMDCNGISHYLENP